MAVPKLNDGAVSFETALGKVAFTLICCILIPTFCVQFDWNKRNTQASKLSVE